MRKIDATSTVRCGIARLAFVLGSCSVLYTLPADALLTDFSFKSSAPGQRLVQASVLGADLGPGGRTAKLALLRTESLSTPASGQRSQLLPSEKTDPPPLSPGDHVRILVAEREEFSGVFEVNRDADPALPK